MPEHKRLVSVRKATLVMPIMGYPDKVLVTVDSFQVCMEKKAGIRSGDLVLLFRANTFLPASTPEFANLVEPQTEYNGQLGVVIHPSAPLVVNGKEKPVFNGLVVPVSDFSAIANHIRTNMGFFKDDDALLNALRNTKTFQTYLNVMEYTPPSGTATPNSRRSLSSTDGSSSLEGSNHTNPTSSLPGLRALPAVPRLHASPATSSPHEIIGFRPYFAPKLDMINAADIKSLFFGGKADTKYAVTTFMVGTPISVYFVRHSSRHIGAVRRAHALPNGRMGVCSRTLDLHRAGTAHPLHWAAAAAAGLPAALNALDRSIVVHGVLVGAALRDNYERMPAPPERAAAAAAEIFAYAVADIDAPNDDTIAVGRMAPTGAPTWRVLTERLGLRTVPQQEDRVALRELAQDHAGLAALADGPGWFVEQRAGLVFRNVKTGRGFKVMSRAYVERYGEDAIRNETQKAKWHKVE